MNIEKLKAEFLAKGGKIKICNAGKYKSFWGHKSSIANKGRKQYTIAHLYNTCSGRKVAQIKRGNMIVNKELRELQKKLKEAMKLLLQENTAKGLHVLAVEIGKIQAQIDRADENGEWGPFPFD